MNKAKYILAFALGMASGVAATYSYFKKRYEKSAQEDIEAVREAYSEHREKTDKEVIYLKEALEKAETFIKAAKKNTDSTVYQITHDDYLDETLRHEKIQLTFFADGVVADEDGDMIPDPSVFVGEEYADIFESTKTDSVYIRNLLRECDYEILRDKRTWAEFDANRPHMSWRSNAKKRE